MHNFPLLPLLFFPPAIYNIDRVEIETRRGEAQQGPPRRSDPCWEEREIMSLLNTKIIVLETTTMVASDVNVDLPTLGTRADTNLELAGGQMWRIAGDNRWRIIICRQGMIWVTQSYDVHDYVLKPGQMCLVTQPGTVLIEALRDAQVEITPAPNRTPYRGDFEETVFA